MYEEFKLNNGISVICERIPYFKSVSIGVWVKCGSCHENHINNGISHFIEHMLFKGTTNRDVMDIAKDIDIIGGQLNAFTGKEYTCYYSKVINTHIDTALDVLSDMLINSRFDVEDIEKEKRVIIEEIGSYIDTPEELIHDLISKVYYGNNTLAFDVLGEIDTVERFNRDSLLDYLNSHYYGGNLVISVTGGFETKELYDSINRFFSPIENKHKSAYVMNNSYDTGETLLISKDTEQVHMCIGLPGIGYDSESFYSLLVLNNIFGGSMSSRLFQKIREDKGLAYSIYSYPVFHLNSGMYSIYAGIKPNQVLEVSQIIVDEINEIMEKGLNEQEIYQSKEQLKGNYILGLESIGSRMSSIGKSKLLLNEVITPDEVIEQIDEVNIKSVKATISEVFNTKHLCGAAIGDSNSINSFKEYIGKVKSD